MAGTGIKDLRPPEPAYDPALLNDEFETIDEKRREHRKRCRLLKIGAARMTGKRKRHLARMARRLANLLDPDRAQIRQRCSSPLYLREERRKVIGAQLKLIEQEQRREGNGE